MYWYVKLRGSIANHIHGSPGVKTEHRLHSSNSGTQASHGDDLLFDGYASDVSEDVNDRFPEDNSLKGADLWYDEDLATLNTSLDPAVTTGIDKKSAPCKRHKLLVPVQVERVEKAAMLLTKRSMQRSSQFSVTQLFVHACACTCAPTSGLLILTSLDNSFAMSLIPAWQRSIHSILCRKKCPTVFDNILKTNFFLVCSSSTLERDCHYQQCGMSCCAKDLHIQSTRNPYIMIDMSVLMLFMTGRHDFFQQLLPFDHSLCSIKWGRLTKWFCLTILITSLFSLHMMK